MNGEMEATAQVQGGNFSGNKILFLSQSINMNPAGLDMQNSFNLFYEFKSEIVHYFGYLNLLLLCSVGAG